MRKHPPFRSQLSSRRHLQAAPSSTLSRRSVSSSASRRRTNSGDWPCRCCSLRRPEHQTLFSLLARQITDLEHTQSTQSCHGLKHHRLTTALPGSRCAIFSQAARSTSQVGFDLECLHSSPTPRRLDSNGSLTASRAGSQLPARDYTNTWICIAGSATKPAATATARSQSSTASNVHCETHSFHDPIGSSCFHSEEAGSFSRMSNSIDAQSKRNPPGTTYSLFSS
jgi:hypothetical protein